MQTEYATAECIALKLIINAVSNRQTVSGINVNRFSISVAGTHLQRCWQVGEGELK